MYRVIMTIYHTELTQVNLFRSKLMVIKVIGTLHYIWDKVREGQTYTEGQVVIVF